MRTVAWPSQASVIWLSDHPAGFGLDGAGIIWRRASAIRVRTRRAARCLEAAAHHVAAPKAAPVPARLYFRNFLRFGFTSALTFTRPWRVSSAFVATWRFCASLKFEQARAPG